MTRLNILRLIPVAIILLSTTACDTSSDRSALEETKDSTPLPAGTNKIDVSVMALGPADGRAVVALSDGRMQVLKVGDTVPGSQAIVMQVLHDKLVVEETIEKAGEPPVKQMAWLYKSGKAGVKSRVQHLDEIGPDKELLQHPGSSVIK